MNKGTNQPVKKEPVNHGMTHYACPSRLKQFGKKSPCCGCFPHDGCDFGNEPIKKEQCEHGIPLFQTCHKCGREMVKPAYIYDPKVRKQYEKTWKKFTTPSPRPDGWETVENEFGAAFLTITNQKTWKNGKPVFYGKQYVTVYNALLDVVKNLLLSTRQEDAKVFRGMIEQATADEFNGDYSEEEKANPLVCYNNALKTVLTALSTWEEKK